MKRVKSLSSRLIVSMVLSAFVPVLIFAVASQITLSTRLEENLETRIEGNIKNSDKCLDAALDKYSNILYELCTDDEVTAVVEKLNQSEDLLDVNSNTLRHELSHICNTNEGIEGITMFLQNGDVIFYDKRNSSSTNSSWAAEVTCPEVLQGTVYQGVTEPIEVGGREIYLFQITRNLIDYKDIRTVLGTVVLSIAEEEIGEALDVGTGAKTFLLDGDTIIGAPDTSYIGQQFEEIEDTSLYRYSTVENTTCGFVICNQQPLEPYNNALQMQVLLLVLTALACIVIIFILSYGMTRSYLRSINSLANAISRVEEGKFTARVDVEPDMPSELLKIGMGFNEMVVRVEELIEQVKQASLEQRKAELSALEAQIDPHFLYNTLDTINWMAIEKDQYAISEMITSLAEILRYTVKNAGGVSTLADELEWLTQYSRLQSLRIGKTPEIDIRVPKELYAYRIHKLLLQPFVENAFKHGFRDKNEKCVLLLSASLMDEQIHIMIADNGNGIPENILRQLNDETIELEGHVGIVNVRKRLKMYYGENAIVYFESAEGTYTRVHLFIPAKEGGLCES